MKIKDVMTDNPVCCLRGTPLEEVARMMLENDCGAIPVVEDQERWKPVGVVTDRDIVTRAVAEGKKPLDMNAGECMSGNPVTVEPDMGLEDSINLMEKHRVRRILVVDRNGGCCGIVSQADIARHAGGREIGEVVEEVSRPSM